MWEKAKSKFPTFSILGGQRGWTSGRGRMAGAVKTFSLDGQLGGSGGGGGGAAGSQPAYPSGTNAPAESPFLGRRPQPMVTRCERGGGGAPQLLQLRTTSGKLKM